MKKIWIVVANSSQAKVYRVESGDVLVEHGIFFHDESRLPGRELVSEGHGRETSVHSYGSDTYEQKTPVKLKEALIFADTLAQFLEQGYHAGEYEKIYLIAKTPFLGHLRSRIHPNIAKLIASEIHKDLNQQRPEEIREYLPLVL